MTRTTFNENDISLYGRLGKDVEEFISRNGNKVYVASLATTRSFKSGDSEEWQSETQWHRIIMFDLNENTIAKLKKGTAVRVKGYLNYREWQDDDGNLHTVAEINANEISVG